MQTLLVTCFRSDPSYRLSCAATWSCKRVRAAVELEEWARAEAMPSCSGNCPEPAVGSGTGRPAAFQPWVFPSPPTEPDVPVSEHPALHEPMAVGYDVVPAAVGVQGVGMLAPR